MTVRSALLGTAMAVAFGGAANAAHLNGWYLSLEGGADWIEDWDHVQNPGLFSATASFDTGWTVLAGVGYAFAGNWRAEFEAGYRANDLDTYTSGGVVPAFGPFTTGDLWEASFMVNLLYDIYLTNNFALSLGGGAGGDFAELTIGPPAITADDWNFAYQGIAGLSFALGRQTDLTLSYRYFRVHEPDFNYLVLAGFVLNGDDFVKHTATIGLRYALQAPQAYVEPPQPPPEPGPVSVPPQQFIVFFGFNKYNLTSEALRVISEAVVAAQQTGSARVLITGHTDTVGSHRYNERLSMRRSNAVKAEMVRQGVPAGSISATGKGETELLVQTADGVKEPQNRRATIDLN